MKIRRIILWDLVFFGIICLLVILSIFSYYRIIALDRQSAFVSHTNEVRLNLEQLLSYVIEAESSQRGFLLTKDSLYLQPYLEAFSRQKEVLTRIDSMIVDNKYQQRSFKVLEWLVTKRLQRLGSGVGDTSQPQITEFIMEGKIVMDRLKSIVNEMIDRENVLLKGRVAEKQQMAYITPLYSLMLSVLAIFTVALTYFILRSEIRLRFHAQDNIKKLNEYFKDLPATFCIIKGSHHVLEMANDLFREFAGKRTLIGKPLKESLPELVGQHFFEMLDGVFTTGKSFIGREMPLDIHRGTGTSVKGYYNFIFQPIFNNAKQVEGILIFGYEITEMIEARDKVAEMEQRSRLAIEAANIGTFDWDMENQHFISSPRLLEIFGFSGMDRVSHQELINCFHPEDKPTRDKAVEASYKKGFLTYEVRVIGHDGVTRWISVYGKIIHSGSKEPLRMYGTVLDTTEQKTIMQELIKSEAQFRLLSDSMPQFVWTADVNGKPNYFSQGLINYSGLTKEEFLDDGMFKIVHPEDQQQTADRWRLAIKLGQEFNFEHRLKSSSGEYRWHLSRALPQKGLNGELQRWVGTSTDIQDQKNLSQKLEQQVNERTQQLSELNDHLLIKNNIFAQAEENALIGSYSWNMQTGELEYSDNLYRLFGYEPNEFVPSFEKYLSLIHPDDKEQVLKDGNETAATKLLVAHTYRIITKDGKIKHFRSTGKVFGSSDNALLIGTVQDISQDKLFNEILQAKNLELERSNAELESFNYIASHDLQEPLRKIQAFSQRILTKEANNFSSFSKDYFIRIHAAAERMQNLIDALLSYSRTNTSSLPGTPTDLNLLVQDVIIDMEDLVEEKQAIINYNGLPTISVVPIQVHQLFINLLSNAIKYSKPGVAPIINVSAASVNGREIPGFNAGNNNKYWAISIADNGIGFEQQYENKIFELFQRLHGTTDYIGTGIGLAICKKIMLNHQGFISAIGKPGEGATFTIYFPVV